MEGCVLLLAFGGAVLLREDFAGLLVSQHVRSEALLEILQAHRQHVNLVADASLALCNGVTEVRHRRLDDNLADPASWVRPRPSLHPRSQHRRLCVIDLSLLVHEVEHSKSRRRKMLHSRFMTERCVHVVDLHVVRHVQAHRVPVHTVPPAEGSLDRAALACSLRSKHAAE